ncbi:MAG: hypothetical protein J6583_13465, partial [Gilliamella sp.]|nr:hypothetical protein [Gilliamella sp.]
GGGHLMKLKKVVLFTSCMFFSLLVKAGTDAVNLPSTKSANLKSKSAVVISSASNLVDTGLTLEKGDVWVWGFRGSSQQGNGKSFEMSNSKPARVKYFANKGLSITQLTAGTYHIIALDEKGNVWGWGQNGYHEASGNNCAGNYPSSPVLVLNKKNVVMISAGEYSSYALTKSGDVYTWGHGIYGQIGNGKKDAVNNVNKLPRQYFNNRPVVLIGDGDNTGYAINNAGEVFGWGYDSATLLFQAKPKKITNLPRGVNGKDIVHITGGDRFTAFLTSSGDVYGMGEGIYLGLNITKSGEKVTKPRRIIRNINALSCQFMGCVAIDKNKRLWTWGVADGSNLIRIPLYGRTPTRRNHIGNLTKIDMGKQHLIYWNDKGQAFGVGHGALHKFSQQTNVDVGWPGREIKFVVDEMKRVYGKKHIPGQGK